MLSAGVEAAAAIVGEEVAHKMVDTVPRAVLKNQSISFPEPRRPVRAHKSLWEKVFRA